LEHPLAVFPGTANNENNNAVRGTEVKKEKGEEKIAAKSCIKAKIKKTHKEKYFDIWNQ
jgi:hypothetical protein